MSSSIIHLASSFARENIKRTTKQKHGIVSRAFLNLLSSSLFNMQNNNRSQSKLMGETSGEGGGGRDGNLQNYLSTLRVEQTTKTKHKKLKSVLQHLKK